MVDRQSFQRRHGTLIFAQSAGTMSTLHAGHILRSLQSTLQARIYIYIFSLIDFIKTQEVINCFLFLGNLLFSITKQTKQTIPPGPHNQAWHQPSQLCCRRQTLIGVLSQQGVMQTMSQATSASTHVLRRTHVDTVSRHSRHGTFAVWSSWRPAVQTKAASRPPLSGKTLPQQSGFGFMVSHRSCSGSKCPLAPKLTRKSPTWTSASRH